MRRQVSSIARRCVQQSAREDCFEIGRSALSWSERQASILTGGGVAEEVYSKSRGFPYHEDELPHYHVNRGHAMDVFRSWRASEQFWFDASVVGVWYRPLFFGGWDRTTSATEDCVNLQTPSFFVDIRVPKVDVAKDDLRLLARRHAFCGYTKFYRIDGYCSYATRHHLIDWNNVDKPRTRPNKWRIEPGRNEWKEWSWATDKFGQSYYVEHWKRTDEVNYSLKHVALVADDCVLLVMGNRFSYCRNRRAEIEKQGIYASCAEAVDAAVERGDEDAARNLLSIDAGHGIVDAETREWTITMSLQPWDQGRNLWDVLLGRPVPHEPRLMFPRATNRDESPFTRFRLSPYNFEILECSEFEDALNSTSAFCEIFHIPYPTKPRR